MDNSGEFSGAVPRGGACRWFVDDPCSHGLFSVVGPDPNSQHTTRLPPICGPHDGWTHGWRRAWGMRSSPFDSLAARGGGVIHAFVATSRKYRRSAGRLRRCEPPPPPNDLSMAIVHLGGLRNCSFCMPRRRGFPRFVMQALCRTNRGARPQSDRCRGLFSRCQHALGAAAVRTALPTRSRQLCPRCRTREGGRPAFTLHSCHPQSAAGRSPVLLLVHQRADVRCRRAGRSGECVGSRARVVRARSLSAWRTVAPRNGVFVMSLHRGEAPFRRTPS